MILRDALTYAVEWVQKDINYLCKHLPENAITTRWIDEKELHLKRLSSFMKTEYWTYEVIDSFLHVAEDIRNKMREEDCGDFLTKGVPDWVATYCDTADTLTAHADNARHYFD